MYSLTPITYIVFTFFSVTEKQYLW